MTAGPKSARQASVTAPGESPKPAPHVCQLCNKSYERADHLHRHLDSHRNERSFKCAECPRGFNRRDLLLRHQAAHAKNAAIGKTGPDRSSERAIKACDPCVISKLKCDNSRPCQRCKKRKIECKTDSLDRDGSSKGHNGSDSSGSGVYSTLTSETSQRREAPNVPASLPSPADSANNNINNKNAYAAGLPMSETAAALEAATSLSQLQEGNNWSIPDMETSLGFPTFFDQIMAPDFVASDTMNLPLDIFNHMPEQDWLSDSMDIFGVDFTPTIDEAFDFTQEISSLPEEEREINRGASMTTAAAAAAATPAVAAMSAQRQDDSTASNGAAGTAPRDARVSARQRHALFQRSPWLWKPEANSHAFSEHGSLPLDESEIDMSASPHQPFLPSLNMHSELTTQSRDRIFQMVLKAAKSHVSIPRFPSVKCLNLLLRVGIAKRMETDAWIHPWTLDAESARPELLAALIAAGCVCFGIPSVSKTGLILFEIVRVALNRLVEDDNSVIRDLQYLQACMMWIDITAFCGFKRKMEIAEHSLQPLVTALRRAGKFDRVAYTSGQDAQVDEASSAEVQWKHWAKLESYKRLIHHLFEHDIMTTITKVRNPLISYAEMTLPLPASRDLWLAPTAETWRITRVEKGARDPKHANLSLRDLLSDSDLLRCLPEDIDSSVAKTAHLHGLAAQTWEHFQQSSLVHSPLASNADPSGKLWVQTRHQQLCQMLQVTQYSSQDAPAVTALFNEFLMLTMHVNPDDITRFAGKCGELEAHRAYQELQNWCPTKRARAAICHAGQVVRLAREVPPYQLRGADAFIIYHALMVLWAYGMMQRDRTRRTRSNTPTATAAAAGSGGSSSRQCPAQAQGAKSNNETPVFLDGEKSSGVDAFLLMGTGRPCLRFRHAGHDESNGNWRGSASTQQLQQCCDVRHAQAVMQVGVQVLEDNYPNELRKNLPQLIRSLCELMRELGALA